jgi:hypothetical protein
MTKPRTDVQKLTDVPNIGPATVRMLAELRITEPRQFIGADPYALYASLKGYHDPCCLDVLISAVRYMEGGPKRPWWHFTEERKRTLAQRSAQD